MTLRELEIRWQAKLLHDWDRLSELIAKIHNVNCTKKTDIKKASYFHPYRQGKSGHNITAQNIHVLKVFAQ